MFKVYCFSKDHPSAVLPDRTQSPSKQLCHCLKNHTGIHSRTREILDDEGEYWSFDIVGNLLFISVHTRRSSENEMFKRTEEHDEVCLRIKHDDDGSHQRMIVKGREQDFSLSITARFR